MAALGSERAANVMRGWARTRSRASRSRWRASARSAPRRPTRSSASSPQAGAAGGGVSGGLDFAREVIERALGPERAAELLGRLSGAHRDAAVRVPAPRAARADRRAPARRVRPDRSRSCSRTCDTLAAGVLPSCPSAQQPGHRAADRAHGRDQHAGDPAGRGRDPQQARRAPASRTTPRRAARRRSPGSSTTPTARPSATSSRTSRAPTRSSPRRSAACCSSSRTSSSSKSAPSSRCCARSTRRISCSRCAAPPRTSRRWSSRTCPSAARRCSRRRWRSSSRSAKGTSTMRRAGSSRSCGGSRKPARS